MTPELDAMRIRTLETKLDEMAKALQKALPVLALNQDHFNRGLGAIVAELERVKTFLGVPPANEVEKSEAKPLDN